MPQFIHLYDKNTHSTSCTGSLGGVNELGFRKRLRWDPKTWWTQDTGEGIIIIVGMHDVSKRNSPSHFPGTSTLKREMNLSIALNKLLLNSGVVNTPWCPLVPQFSQACSHPLSYPCNPLINYLLRLTKVTFCFMQLKSPKWCNTPISCFLSILSTGTLEIYQVPAVKLGIMVKNVIRMPWLGRLSG